MQRRSLVLILLGIIVVGCIVIALVLSQKNKSDEFEDTFIFNVNTSSYNNRLFSHGFELDKVPAIDRKLFYELNAKCGQDLGERIVGGTATGLFDYTWTAVLDYDIQSWGCGGSLISDRYVLTAAHCITNEEIGPPSRVILGDYNLTSEIDCVPPYPGDKEICATAPITVDIERIDVHPNWLKQKCQFYDDIALIRLAEPVKSKDIQTICLPNESYVPDNQTKFVSAGWGLTENGVASDVKLQVSLPLFPKEFCIKRLERYIKDRQICAGGKKGKDTCNGDSGGPLMVIPPESDRWSIAGVVSMGAAKCGMEAVPAVYTFIPKYIDWIFEKMKP